MTSYTTDLTIQKATSELQISNFFKNYPLEFIQGNMETLFEKYIPHPTEHPSISSTYLFYEELNLVLKNCEFLYNLETNNCMHAVVRFLTEVVPTAYIFCSYSSALRIDLIIVMDQYKYKPLDEIYTLLDFALLGHKNINCSVYTYATIHHFLSKGHLYFSALCTPENCIYKSTSKFSLPVLSPEKYNDLIHTSTELFNQNLQKAIFFFKSACQFADESECPISGFMIQQACELTYRSLLLTLRGKQIKCHDLVVLRKHLSHFTPAIIGILDQDLKKEIELLNSIQEAYIKSRYDQTFTISRNDLETYIVAAGKLIEYAKQVFDSHCQKVKSINI